MAEKVRSITFDCDDLAISGVELLDFLFPPPSCRYYSPNTLDLASYFISNIFFCDENKQENRIVDQD